MNRRRKQRKSSLSMYDLIDRYMPAYIEYKEGSTNLSATYLSIIGLTDGCYVWHITNAVQQLLNGRRIDWQVGNSGFTFEQKQVYQTFAEALEVGRKSMKTHIGFDPDRVLAVAIKGLSHAVKSTL